MTVLKNKAQSAGGKKSKRAISPHEQKRLQAARLVAREKNAKMIVDAIKSWGPGKYKKVEGIVFAITDGSIPLTIQHILKKNPFIVVKNATSKEFVAYYIEKYGSPDIGPEKAEWRKMDKTPERNAIDEP